MVVCFQYFNEKGVTIEVNVIDFECERGGRMFLG